MPRRLRWRRSGFLTCLAKPHGQTRELRLLADHRDDLVQENTRYQRRLRQHVHEIDPDLAPALRGLNSATNLDRLARQLAKHQQTAQVQIARELVRRIRELAKRTRQLHTEIARLVRARCPQLLEIEGCGPITAARIYAEVDGIDRFKNERHLASYAGIAPLDASSGRQQRHRLNRTGNRRCMSTGNLRSRCTRSRPGYLRSHRVHSRRRTTAEALVSG
jgi:transposase